MYPKDYPLGPSAMWKRFYELTQTPRPSKKEEKVRQYLIDSAVKANLEYKTDDVGNVVIYIPGTNGKESSPPVILQSHMDMVCDKLPEIKFDFENDPLNVFVENGWIHARGTTLGADNGLGCAVMLAFIDERDLSHPPLELFFTVDEETGLHGALNFDPSMLSGRTLINIDSEDWGDVYVGCAGGVDCELKREMPLAPQIKSHKTIRLDIEGLTGGHSGMDIIKGRGTAIKVLATVLSRALNLGIHIVEFQSGKAHNIIPRDGYVVLNIDESKISQFENICKSVVDDYKAILPSEDRKFLYSIQELNSNVTKSLSKSDTEKFIRIITLFPHGPHGFNWDADIPLVSYSNNLAIVSLIAGDLYIETSLRFFDRREACLIEDVLKSVGEEYGLDLIKASEYPSWKPSFDGRLLEIVKDQFKSQYGRDMKVKAIHAGLECGIIKDRLGELDAISIGPNISGVHSPSEKVEIESSNKFWDLMTGLLARL